MQPPHEKGFTLLHATLGVLDPNLPGREFSDLHGFAAQVAVAKQELSFRRPHCLLVSVLDLAGNCVFQFTYGGLTEKWFPDFAIDGPNIVPTGETPDAGASELVDDRVVKGTRSEKWLAGSLFDRLIAELEAIEARYSRPLQRAIDSKIGDLGPGRDVRVGSWCVFRAKLSSLDWKVPTVPPIFDGGTTNSLSGSTAGAASGGPGQDQFRFPGVDSSLPTPRGKEEEEDAVMKDPLFHDFRDALREAGGCDFWLSIFLSGANCPGASMLVEIVAVEKGYNPKTQWKWGMPEKLVVFER